MGIVNRSSFYIVLDGISTTSSIENSMKRRIVIVSMLIIAISPVCIWYIRRMSDGSDEPWGILALITFTVFVVFYVPCLATMAALRRELNTRDMFLIAGITVVIALVTALIARWIAILFL